MYRNITDYRLKDNRIFPLVAFCIVLIWCMRTVFFCILSVQLYACHFIIVPWVRNEHIKYIHICIYIYNQFAVQLDNFVSWSWQLYVRWHTDMRYYGNVRHGISLPRCSPQCHRMYSWDKIKWGDQRTSWHAVYMNHWIYTISHKTCTRLFITMTS